MQLDELKETLQEFFQENTVTIVGSGLSSAEDIPGMGGLSKFLIAEVPGKIHEQSDIDAWNKISAELATGKGLEAVLLNNAPTDKLEVAIRDVTASLLGKRSRRLLKKLYKESAFSVSLSIWIVLICGMMASQSLLRIMTVSLSMPASLTKFGLTPCLSGTILLISIPTRASICFAKVRPNGTTARRLSIRRECRSTNHTAV